MTATVDGVLEHNKKIRDEMLKHNIGKYSQWPFALKPAIGEYYDIDYNRKPSNVNDGKSLLSFTHDEKSNYSKEIKKRFFPSKEKETYFVRPLIYGELNPWIDFQNGSYIQYIDEVFGKDAIMRHVNYVNDFLSGQFIENALRQTEVGVIKDINVSAALQGIITTNPNNMSGKDSIMGMIGNRMYAKTLYNGAIFNSDRMKAKIRDGENFYQKAYLTPELVNQYGNNLANIYELSDILKIGVNETQVREDLGGDVHIIDKYTKNNALQFRILNEQIKRAIELRGVNTKTRSSNVTQWIDGRKDYKDKNGNDIPLKVTVYTPIDGEGYINPSRKDSDWRYETLGFVDVDGDSLKSQSTTGGRLYGTYSANVYNEKEDGKAIPGTDKLNDESNQHNIYRVIDDDSTSLLSKTSRLFHQNKIDTLIARFHTDSTKYGMPEFTDTARSEFGNSHGRNLLKLKDNNRRDNDTKGYDNPYCRTWTYHHQYNQVKKLIRPFINDDGEAYGNRDIQSMNKKYRAYRADNNGNAVFGYQSLADNTVLQDNGFVRITPKFGDGGIDVRKCMFSIENLAWKDVLDVEDNLSREQRGPNGGRIMWFPPYDLDFQEGVNVEWNQNTFIGRGEKVYTYTNTDRTGTLSFSLLIDHPAIINSVAKCNYKGMPKEEDPEADILRFFAGCELLEEPQKLVSRDEIRNGKTSPTIGSKENKIVFRIYYPNNFSGIVSNTNECKKIKNGSNNIIYNSFKGYVLETEDGVKAICDDYNEYYKSDYWWQYILVGNNTCIPVDEKYFRGYEMSRGGLKTDDQYTNIKLHICKDNKYTVHPENLNTINDGSERNTCNFGLDTLNNEHLYYYQIDEDLHQQLNNKDSYKDSRSLQLNSKLPSGSKNDYEYTFAEVIMALLKHKKNDSYYGNLYEKYIGYVTGLDVSQDRINRLAGLFDDKQITFTDISYTGNADKNDQTNADMLACRRAYTGFDMLRRLLGDKINKIDLNTKSNTNTGGKPGVDANDDSQKKARFCEFTISYSIKSEELKNTNTNNGNNVSGNTSGETQWQEINQKRPDTKENKATKQEEKKMNEVAMVYGTDTNISNIRYETEGEYFENIEVTDPLLWRNLKDKFRYFNPAYHSISPEGFNARLTFLQQCTRQGQTYELASNQAKSVNGYSRTASNLAFGRMPVCVIRIGDFINTRAIINNMTISYAAANGVVWDLNSEGAGVQPMYAKVSLGITLLGGQSLGAPISRLQNAISFNYYANTEAYDNRADVATYEENSREGGYSVTYKRLWTPLEKADEIDTSKNMIWVEPDDESDMQGEAFKATTSGQMSEAVKNKTSAKTEQDEIVYSKEISDYVNSNSVVKKMLKKFTPRGKGKDVLVYVYCDKNFIDSGYDYNLYKKENIGFTCNGDLPKKGVDVEEFSKDFEILIKTLIERFVQK